MSKRGSFVKQAAILAAAGLFVRFIGFLYRIPITDMIGDVGNGIYGASYSVYTFLLTLSAAALPAAIGRMVSERLARGEHRNAHQVFKVSLQIGAVLGLAGALALGLGSNFFAELLGRPESHLAILTLAPTVFIVTCLAVFRGYFQGMNTMVPTALSQVVEQVFNAGFSVLLTYLLVSKGLAYGAAGGTAGTGIGALAALIFIAFTYRVIRPIVAKNIRKEMRDRDKSHVIESNRSIVVALAQTAFPIIIGASIGNLTGIIDSRMVTAGLTASNAFSPERIDALFGQLSGKFVLLTTLPVSFSTAFATAVVPNIASSFAINDTETVNRKINMALRMTMVIAIPSAVGLFVLSDQILFLLFRHHAEGGALLMVGAVSVIFLSLAQISAGILQGVGRFYLPAINVGVGVIIKIILNHYLIQNPKINIQGAVISTVACYLVVSILDLIAMRQVLKVKLNLVGSLLKPMISAIAMGIACYSFYYIVFFITGSNSLSTIAAICISVIVYFIFMLLCGGLNRSDVSGLPGGKILISAMVRIGVYRSEE